MKRSSRSGPESSKLSAKQLSSLLGAAAASAGDICRCKEARLRIVKTKGRLLI